MLLSFAFHIIFVMDFIFVTISTHCNPVFAFIIWYLIIVWKLTPSLCHCQWAAANSIQLLHTSNAAPNWLFFATNVSVPLLVLISVQAKFWPSQTGNQLLEAYLPLYISLFKLWVALARLKGSWRGRHRYQICRQFVPNLLFWCSYLSSKASIGHLGGNVLCFLALVPHWYYLRAQYWGRSHH